MNTGPTGEWAPGWAPPTPAPGRRMQRLGAGRAGRGWGRAAGCEVRGPSSERGLRGSGTWETPGTHDCCRVGTLGARLALGRVRSRDPWGGRVPSRWERGAGGDAAHRVGAPASPPGSGTWRLGRAAPAAPTRADAGSAAGRTRGGGQSRPPLIPATSSSGFRRAVGGAGGLRGSRWGGEQLRGGPSGRGWGLGGPGRRGERGAAAAGSGPRSSGAGRGEELRRVCGVSRRPRSAAAFPEPSVCEDASLALGCKCLSRL